MRTFKAGPDDRARAGFYSAVSFRYFAVSFRANGISAVWIRAGCKRS